MKIAGVGTASALAVGMGAGATGCSLSTAEKVSYSNRDLPVLYAAEVCVVGGGPSGIAAAVSAAKKGSQVALVERGIQLGGLQTMGDVIPCMTT